MAVDHGLGGKDNKKSQMRREKKARRIKAVSAKALQSGTKKKEVAFDEQARVEYLTGFHRRKQERRKFGLAMQILKDKKKHKDDLKDQRAAVKAASMSQQSSDAKLSRGEKKRKAAAEAENSDDEYEYDHGDDEDDGDADNGEGEGEGEGTIGEGELVFEDDTTTSMFGGVVSVVVDSGVADDLDAQNNPDLAAENYRPIDHHKQREKKELTRLEKALKEVGQKGLMNRKTKGGSGGPKHSSAEGGKRGNKSGAKAVSHRSTGGKQLYHKALGSGALGANVFKASNKGKRS